MRLAGFPGLACLTLSGASVAIANESAQVEVTMQPGYWETTSEIFNLNSTNLPQGVSLPIPAPITSRTCLTAAEVSAFGQDFPPSDASMNCTSENYAMAGGRLQATIQCNESGMQTRITLNGRYTQTSLELDQHVETIASEMATELDVRVIMHRVGDCPG